MTTLRSMNLRITCLLSFAIFLPVFVATASPQIVYQNDFDQHTQSGPYTDDELDADWNEPIWNNGVTEGRTTIVHGSQAYGGSGSCLAVHYPADEHGTRETGAQWQLRLGDSYEEMYLSYRVKFENGFDFVRGGKLPGLAGGEAPSGSDPATGENGWTGRLMWRTDFTGQSGSPEQTVSQGISYAKHMDSGFAQDGVQEDKEYWVGADGVNSKLDSGVWYQITQRIKMNTPSQPDGILQIWLDGELVIDRSNVRFRSTADLAIDMLYFSTFFGGGSSWATSKDEIVYFDDFVVSAPESRARRVPQQYGTIQAALDAAAPGDFVIIRDTQVANIVIDKPITVRGFAGTRLIPANTSQPAITVKFSSARLERIQIENAFFGVKIDDGRTNVRVALVNAVDGVSGFVVGSDCHHTDLFRCRASDNMGNGFRIASSDHVQIDDCTALNNGGHGFFLSNCDSANFTDNLSNLNSGHGVVATGDSNYFFDNVSRFNLLHGYFIKGDGHTIAENDARRNSLDGFCFSNSSNGTCVDNVSRTNSRAGFRWSSSSNRNTIVGNEGQANTLQGIVVDSSSDNSIDGCRATNNAGDGVLLTTRSHENAVTGSTATGNGGSAFRNNGADNTLSGNTSDDGT